MDKLIIYVSLGNLTSYADFIEKELSNKELADKIREEVDSIRKYLLEI